MKYWGDTELRMRPEEAATERERYYRSQEVSHWRMKRLRTHNQLIAARREIVRLRALLPPARPKQEG